MCRQPHFTAMGAHFTAEDAATEDTWKTWRRPEWDLAFDVWMDTAPAQHHRTDSYLVFACADLHITLVKLGLS